MVLCSDPEFGSNHRSRQRKSLWTALNLQVVEYRVLREAIQLNRSAINYRAAQPGGRGEKAGSQLEKFSAGGLSWHTVWMRNGR